MRRANQKRRLTERAAELIQRNVENLRWATLQNISEAFHRFGARLDEDLAEAIQATHGAIRAAHQKRRESAERVAADIQRLETASAALKGVRDEFSHFASLSEGGRATIGT